MRNRNSNAHSLTSISQCLDLCASQAAAGVGVVVPEAEITRLVRETADAQRDKIVEKGYGYSGPFTGSLRKVDALRFAPPEIVVKATEEVFAEILGEKTADNTKKTKSEREAPPQVMTINTPNSPFPFLLALLLLSPVPLMSS